MLKKIFLSVTLFLSAFISFAQTKARQDSVEMIAPIKVTLLGTGTPQPLMERFGPSILVQAGGKTLLFDAGRGCLQRLRQLNLAYDTLDAVFFTHLHSDHIVGFPDLWLTGWLLSNRSIPLKVFGPEGTKEMTDYLRKAYAFDIKIRGNDTAFQKGIKLLTTDIKEGVVYEKEGVKVIAFLVDHYPVVPAFGYRIEYSGYSVVLSGDTRYSENLIRFAKGTDLLVHEVAVGSNTLSRSDLNNSILSHHTTPEEAGKVFNAVKPKLAVYSHIIILNGHNTGELTQRTNASYSAKWILGEDLMSFNVGENVTIKTWDKK
jgi:ribonuclease Z